jgi:TP53 regulating kinase-like protein
MSASEKTTGTGTGTGTSTGTGTGWELKHQGAESRIKYGLFAGRPSLVKERFIKKYRDPELDERLTRERVRAEVRAFMKIKDKCNSLGQLMPTILLVTERNIVMTRLEEARTSCDVIKEGREKGLDMNWMFEGIGTVVGQIHGECGLIHGDLTTSNIMVTLDKKLVPIDFGLASVSGSAEDRAVDLYVLERALQSTHVDAASFQVVLQAYEKAMSKPGSGQEVLKRLEEVRARGRKRLMIG